jgi:hypothetical protein
MKSTPSGGTAEHAINVVAGASESTVRSKYSFHTLGATEIDNMTVRNFTESMADVQSHSQVTMKETAPHCGNTISQSHDLGFLCFARMISESSHFTQAVASAQQLDVYIVQLLWRLQRATCSCSCGDTQRLFVNFDVNFVSDHTSSPDIRGKSCFLEKPHAS